MHAGDQAEAPALPPKTKKKASRLEAVRHPLRARVLRMLVERGELSPAGLSRILEADLSDVSHHVKRLEALDCADEEGLEERLGGVRTLSARDGRDRAAQLSEAP